VLGTLTFVSSEAIFFGALVATYLAYRARSPSGPGPGDLELARTALFSVALFASSGTAWRADRALARGSARGFLGWLAVTIALGAVFLTGQLTEYGNLYAEQVTLASNLFTSAFFTLTGFHGLHVALGLVALAVLAGLALAGDFRGGRHHAAVSAVSVYWHFVDAVWVVIFSVVYLGALLE
jgi:heme/copper-type cytochrome/quinol oxidase subunit 3